MAEELGLFLMTVAKDKKSDYSAMITVLLATKDSVSTVTNIALRTSEMMVSFAEKLNTAEEEDSPGNLEMD
jgi:hypothetical protein